MEILAVWVSGIQSALVLSATSAATAARGGMYVVSYKFWLIIMHEKLCVKSLIKCGAAYLQQADLIDGLNFSAGQQAACSGNQLLSAEREKVKKLTREIILRKKHNN